MGLLHSENWTFFRGPTVKLLVPGFPQFHLQNVTATADWIACEYSNGPVAMKGSFIRRIPTGQFLENTGPAIREVKHDVIGRGQTAKIASDFEFFSFVRK